MYDVGICKEEIAKDLKLVISIKGQYILRNICSGEI